MASPPRKSLRTTARDAANLGHRALLRRTARALQGCESVLDVGCGHETILGELPPIAHRVGVDGHARAIESSRERGLHHDYLQADVRELPYPAGSFDAVIAFDLLEHLEAADGRALLRRAEDIARRVVVLFTPNGWVDQDEYDDNPLQAHRAGWTADELRAEGYEVWGMKGLRALRGEGSEPRPPRALTRGLLSLSQPVVERVPGAAYSLLAVRRAS